MKVDITTDAEEMEVKW